MTDEHESDSRPTIAFVGDSLTARGSWQDWFPDVRAINLGVDGDTSDEVIVRSAGISELKPQTIALLIGTNDLGNRRSVEHLVRNVELLLVSLRRDAPTARVLVQSILPRERAFATRIEDANRHLWQFSPGVGATWLDLWPAFATDDGSIHPDLSDDGLHLTDAGYGAWLSLLQPAVAALAD
jgi:lysophospholipase L1-like esterase